MQFIEALKPGHRSIALGVILVAAIGLWLYGPVVQPAHYHDFADRRGWLSLPNAGDLLSNIPYFIIGLWGWLRLSARRDDALMALAWPGYALFCAGLILTAFGSGYYHWAPTDERLIWDRLPIALLCAGLLAGAYAEVDRSSALRPAILLGLFGAASVWWWSYSGDLRPYFLLQFAPLLLIPIWQHLRDAPRAERVFFGMALLIYVPARLTEIFDVQIYTTLGTISGHTLKHLLSAVATAFIIAAVLKRIEAQRKDADALAPLSAW